MSSASNARFMSSAYMRQVAAEAAAERREAEAAAAIEAIKRKKERERGAVGTQLAPLNFNLEAGEGPIRTPSPGPRIENVDGGRRKSRKSKRRAARKTRSRRY